LLDEAHMNAIFKKLQKISHGYKYTIIIVVLLKSKGRGYVDLIV
jgi:hypothetical protein